MLPKIGLFAIQTFSPLGFKDLYGLKKTFSAKFSFFIGL
jgi:hypothetical protein